MNLISAGLKFIARSVNDAVFRRQVRTAKNASFRQTGKAIQQARKKGKFVNGFKLYRNNLAVNIEKAK